MKDLFIDNNNKLTKNGKRFLIKFVFLMPFMILIYKIKYLFVKEV